VSSALAPTSDDGIKTRQGWKVVSDIRCEVYLKLNKVAERYLQNNWA